MTELERLQQGIASVLRAYDSAQLVEVEWSRPERELPWVASDTLVRYEPGPESTTTFRFHHGWPRRPDPSEETT